MNDKIPTGRDFTPEELREQARITREELGHTVRALAEKADVTAQAKEKADLVRQQVQDTAAQAWATARDSTPEPVREKAVQAAATANRNRGPVIAGAAALAVVLTLVVCRRRARR
ncbi:DUF3618 domain-containing protein [Streptomyces sp. NPDC014894]|uniref:DUF3618 domain-containing protein n=1 Tax=unclassified Streptomyces TaxID=2593676 RepID=UPI0036F840FB